MLYAMIDSAVAFLRARVRRDSWTWKLLRTARVTLGKGISLYRRNSAITNRWQAREKELEHLIEQWSTERDRFFVIQIGACDGLMDDPIYKWINKYRWHGILVEPQTREFERLKRTYADHSDRLRFDNVAISETAEPRRLYKVRDAAIRGD